MISIAILLLLLAVHVAAGWEYPPLFLNAAVIAVLIVVAGQELRAQKRPGELVRDED